ncbi:MAG: tetratricopeptide repeat protein [Spirochaetota bacterium]
MKRIVFCFFSFWLFISSLSGQDFGNVYQETAAVQSFLQKKEYDEAIRILESLLLREPDYVIGHNLMGYSYMAKGNYRKAEFYYRKSIQISENLDGMLGLQKVLLLQKSYAESARVGESALRLSEESYWANVRLAEAYAYLKKYDKSIALYDKTMDYHGRNADLLWRKGLVLFLQGKKNKAVSLWQEGYEKQPEHPGIRYALGLSTQKSYFLISPFYSKYSFSGSSIKSGGEKIGVAVSYSWQDSWTVVAAQYRDITQSLLASSSSYVNYIFDEYNLLQYSFYTTEAEFYSYIGNAYNSYQFYQIASAEDFVTYQTSIGARYKANHRLAYFFSGHYLQTNDEYTRNAGIVEAGVAFGQRDIFSASLSGLSYPKHSGLQVSLAYDWNFWNSLWSSSTVNLQTINLTLNDLLLYNLNPVYTYSYSYTESKQNVAFRQEFRYYWRFWQFSLFGRVGDSYTPTQFGDVVYNPAYLKLGMGGFVQMNYDRYSLSLSYAKDKWENLLQETVNSDTWSVKFTWRLP